MSTIDSCLGDMLDLFAFDSTESPITSDLGHSRKSSDASISSIEAHPGVLRNKAGKPRKLRASCDACSLAKVKCSKEHPICLRCSNNGSSCHYSPSMRLGKPRSKPKDPNAPDTAVHAKTNAGIQKKPRRRTHSVTTVKAPIADTDMVNSSELSLFDDVQFDTGLCDADLSLSHELDGLLDPSVYSDPLTDFHKPLQPPHANIIGLGEPLNATADASSINLFQQSPHSLDLLLPALSEDSDDDLSSAFASSVGTPTSARSSITEVSPAPDSSFGRSLPKHDCTALAFSTLNELSTLSGAPFTNANEFDELIMLDALLSICQTGIDNVSTLLECPCSRHPHFSTTVAFIVIKVLSWYQTLSGLAQGLPPFGFDGEINSATTLRSQSIRWELRRIERLIDDFPNRFGTSSDTGVDIDKNVYVHLQSLLRAKLRETLECTIQRIK